MDRRDAASPGETRQDPRNVPSPGVIHTHYGGISRSFAPFLSPRVLWRSLWGNRALLRQLSKSRFSAGHREDLLGVAWVVVEPIVMLAVYSIVFIRFFGVRWENVPGGGFGTALNLYAGIVTYQIFAQTLVMAAAIVRDSVGYVKLMVFPTEVLPASVVGGLVAPTSVGYLLIIVTSVAAGIGPPVTVLLLPVVLVPMYLMILGLSWFLSTLCVFVHDTRTITQIVTGFGFFATPIVYSLDSERITTSLRTVLLFNPMTTIVESVRAVLILGRMPSWTALGVLTVVSALVCQAGFAFFMRSKRAFADVI
jgi:lipopolysaccharide transport system permease protein